MINKVNSQSQTSSINANKTNSKNPDTSSQSFKGLHFIDYRPRSPLYALKKEIFELKSEKPLYKLFPFLNPEPQGIVRGGTTTVLFGEGFYSDALMEKTCAKLQNELDALKFEKLAKEKSPKSKLDTFIDKLLGN